MTYHHKSVIWKSRFLANRGELLASESAQKFSRREVIPLWHGILWKIDKGMVRTLTWSEEGTIITLGIWGPGDIVGKALSGIDPYQIECLGNTEVTIIPSHLTNETSGAMLKHIQQAQELLGIIRRERVYFCLLQLLLWLGEKFGSKMEQGWSLDLPLTHQDMADVIGTTRVTVTRLLKQFQDEGIIKRQRR